MSAHVARYAAAGSNRAVLAAGIAILAGLCSEGKVHAAAMMTIAVPNNSFESQLASPVTDVTNNIDDWQKTAQPQNFVSPNGLTWDQQTGIFGNTPTGQPNHINNADGNQSAYLFDVPGVGLFQDYNSTDWQNLPPSHLFNQVYQAQHTYTLTLGVIGGGGSMQPGAVLDMILYYRNGLGQIVPLVDKPITYTTADFPTKTDLIDYSVKLPEVGGADPEAAQNIGIEFLSTAGEGAGYWDVDNVRLTTQTPEPGSVVLLVAGLGAMLSARPWRRALS